jgi:hypothetical protein
VLEESVLEWQKANSQLTIKIADSEIAMFEHIRAMETVHNELGHNLSLFKDQIVQSRNEYMVKLCEKYHILKPNMITYDPVGKQLISIFHNNMPFVRIKSKPPMFTTLASELIFQAIKTLTGAFKMSGGQNEKGIQK